MKEQNKVTRTPCQIYTRVMWYFRPVSMYNVWKKSEFYSRKYFKEPSMLTKNNKDFIAKYGTTPASS